jgi:hypothetical protein
MALLALVHPCEQVQISVEQLVAKCTLFKNKRKLLRAPYEVASPIPASVFRAFVSGLEGSSIEITSANWAPLSLLSDEFGFDSLSADLSAFRPHPPVQGLRAIADGDGRSRIVSLEERSLGREPRNCGSSGGSRAFERESRSALIRGRIPPRCAGGRREPHFGELGAAVAAERGIPLRFARRGSLRISSDHSGGCGRRSPFTDRGSRGAGARAGPRKCGSGGAALESGGESRSSTPASRLKCPLCRWSRNAPSSRTHPRC